MKSRWKTKALCGVEGTVWKRRRRVETKASYRSLSAQWKTDEEVGTKNSRKNVPLEQCRRKQSSEEAVEAKPKTIERTLS